MIKIILTVSLFALTSYLGFQFSNVFKSKECFFLDLLNFTKSLKSEISFLKTNILDILKKNDYKSKFASFLNDYKNEFDNDKKVSKSQIVELLKKNIDIKNDECENISQMFCELGNVGYYEQIEMLEYYCEIYKNYYESSKEKSSKMMPLCRKMGVLIGLLVCIVLI